MVLLHENTPGEKMNEQEIIEEIINSVKSRKFRAWIHNIVFNKDDWEDDFDTTIEAIEALNDALDDNGRKDCDWGIDEVKTYNQIEIELAVKKALQKGKELGILTTAPQMPKSLAKGMRKKGEACEGCEHVILREDNTWCVSCTRQFNRGVDSGIYQEQERVSKLINDVRSPEVVIWAHKDRIKNQASKIEELEKENKELKEKIKVLDDCFQGSMEDFTKLLKQNSKLADEIDERYKNSLHPQKITDCWHKKMIKKLRGEK